MTEAALLPLITVFLLVLTRISGLLMVAPGFGTRAAPPRVRALLALTMTALVAPTLWSFSIPLPQNLIQLLLMLTGEAAIGLTMGLVMLIIFTGLQIAGQVVGQMSGMQLSDVYDPVYDTSVPVFARLLDLLSVAVFLAIGGHHRVLRALLDTFQALPVGRAWLTVSLKDLQELLLATLHQSFEAGLRAASPIMMSLLLAILVTGLISRTLPQLNILAIGFSINGLVLMASLLFSLGIIVTVFQSQIDVALESAQVALLRSLPAAP